VVAPSGRAYEIGAAPPADVRGRGPFGIAVTECGVGRVHLEPVRDGGMFRVRVEELETGIRTGSWLPPELPPERRARQQKYEARKEASLAHPVAAGAKTAIRTAVFAVVIAVITLIQPTPDLSDIARAMVVVTAVSVAYGLLTTVSLKCAARRSAP
jgi:hypothetical protein